MNILERLWFRAKTGADIRELNSGNPVEPIVIRYKDFYFQIMLDTESGEPVDWGWSDDPMMFANQTPIREYLIATQNPAYDESETGLVKDSIS